MSALRRPRATIVAAAVLGLFLVVAGILSISGFSGVAGIFGGARVSTIGAVNFHNRLAIPPLAPSTIDASGQRTFTLTAQPGTTDFQNGTPTQTWGYNGSYLGPTLVAERGEHVRVVVKNDLDEPTTLHWHGMHLPPAMDGGPHQMIEPGAQWFPNWQIDQPAATLWYHPHPHGETEKQVARGLAGLFYVTDPVERALHLPHDYGVDDIPLIVQDVRFAADGSLDRQGGFIGALGNQILVNGTLAPVLNVNRSVIRLRLLNASTARVLNFQFSDGRDLILAATDGGLLPQPERMKSLRLSPGERAEVLVPMVAGDSVVLQSRNPPLGDVVPFGGPDGGSDQFDVLQIDAATKLDTAGTIPTQLAPMERLREADATAARSFVLGDKTINGLSMDLRRVDEVVLLGSTEIWSIKNGVAIPHNFHIHDVQFQILDVNGAPPPPSLRGWKDTIYVEPNATYRLIMHFADYSDPDMPYMYHCHLLTHEDAGLMGQFVVVKRGESAGVPSGATHNH